MKTFNITTTEKNTGKVIIIQRKAATSYEALISAKKIITKNYGAVSDLIVKEVA